MTASKLNRAPLRSLSVDALAIGIDKKRKSFDDDAELDAHALDLNRSIDKLIEEEDEDDLSEGSSKSVDEAPTKAALNPKFTRGYTIGTTGFEHLLYDIHATHQLDLHSVVNKPSDGKPADKTDEVDSPAKWLQRLADERKERRADAFAPGPSAAEPASGKASMQKQWALLRASSLLLGALNASRAAGSASEGPSSPQNTTQWQPPLPAFDVQAFIEQSFLQQAQSGELSDLFATMGGAYNDNQLLMQMQQQQQFLYEQQQYFMAMQQQQQQLHLQQLQQLQQQQMHVPQQYAAAQPPPPAHPSQLPPRPQQQQRSAAAQSAQRQSPPRQSPQSPVSTTAGRLVEMAQSKEGSLTLQKALHSMSPAKLQEACDELAPHIGTLAMDTFGNYLVSSIIKLPQAQPAIVAALTGRVVELSIHQQGSRVVQSALEALPAATAGALVSELAGHIARVAAQTCGSWSIVAAYKATHAAFILAEVANAVGYLSTLQDGSRVVQRVIPEAASHGADVSGVLDALLAQGYRLGHLAADQYGNYVVQKALYHSDAERRSRLVELLLPSLPSLSTSKAGSNAAEAIIASLSAERLPDAHRALLFECSVNLATDRFGKHVIAAFHRRAATLGINM